MKTKTLKTLKIVSVFTLIFIIAYVVLYALQAVLILADGGKNHAININGGFKLSWFIGHRILIFIVAALLIAFVVNIIKSIKNGAIFNRTNVKLLWALAVVMPIYTFVADNVGTVCSAMGNGQVVLTDRPFVFVSLTLLVATLYKLAYDAAEEQKLTI